MQENTIELFIILLLVLPGMVLIWRCNGTRDITLGQFFNDSTSRMGYAIGLVFNFDSHLAHNCWTFVPFVWKTTFGFSGYSIQNGKFYDTKIGNVCP